MSFSTHDVALGVRPARLAVLIAATDKDWRFTALRVLEWTNRVIPLGEAHLRDLIREYMAHYDAERPHQGLGGVFVQPSNDHAADGPLARRERLGGLLNYYYREAA